MERFWSKVDKNDPSGCYVWTAGLRHGYGQYYADGSHVAAHKYIYEKTHGPVPDGFELDHLCANRSCVRIEHLEVVTHRENIKRIFQRRGPKPFCVRGHEMTDENTMHYHWRGRHKRMCRACIAENKARYKLEGRRRVGYAKPL